MNQSPYCLRPNENPQTAKQFKTSLLHSSPLSLNLGENKKHTNEPNLTFKIFLNQNSRSIFFFFTPYKSNLLGAFLSLSGFLLGCTTGGTTAVLLWLLRGDVTLPDNVRPRQMPFSEESESGSFNSLASTRSGSGEASDVRSRPSKGVLDSNSLSSPLLHSMWST